MVLPGQHNCFFFRSLGDGDDPFSNDDVAFYGPLSRLVSTDTGSLLSGWHRSTEELIYALLALHILAIVLYRLNRQSPRAIHDYDMDAFFDRIDLLNHLSPTRGNGLRAMVGKIKQQAQSLTA